MRPAVNLVSAILTLHFLLIGVACVGACVRSRLERARGAAFVRANVIFISLSAQVRVQLCVRQSGMWDVCVVAQHVSSYSSS